MPTTNRILVKMRAGAALAAAPLKVRPLLDYAPTRLAAAPAPAWYIAELPAAGPSPWDAAHDQVAGALGLSASDIIYTEPDLPQRFVDSNEGNPGAQAMAAAPDCSETPQSTDGGAVSGPGFGWHLDDGFSQLRSARNAVNFADPRTRIAHIDTGYDRGQAARPGHILTTLEHNFADDNGDPNSAQDPNRRTGLTDNSGHGTGTIGILAGGRVAQNNNDFLGGAPEADILPIRIAGSVVLFYTSTFATGLNYAIDHDCDVVSLSMGGLPSALWSEAVNRAYEAGVCIVAAAGNCYHGAPTSNVVYPARYGRAIAVSGVMENGVPYYNLRWNVMEGCWGPASAMTHAIAAYTPNIPWAKFLCPTAIRLNGEGTSAATPQVAAAAALWIEKYKAQLSRDWRRVEAVRNALFTSTSTIDSIHLGHGVLRANKALSIAPALNLPQTPPDSDSFAFLRVLSGLGLAESDARQQMFDVETAQRWMCNQDLRDAVPDPDGPVSDAARKKFLDALIADSGASLALRRHLQTAYSSAYGGPAPSPVPPANAPAQPAAGGAPAPAPGQSPFDSAAGYKTPKIPDPPFRRIRVYAIDPSYSTRFMTAEISQAVLNVSWEKDLKPGPLGEYLEVVDKDPSGFTYEPVDLSNARLAAQDGFAPSEGNPGFHQQMVYAVAMNTIAHFETALGRRVQWRARPDPANSAIENQFTPRLRIVPHAMREANSFYAPDQVALQFGYFEAGSTSPKELIPGSTVFTCLSHDVVAHETTHAIVDGMYNRFREATNPDVLAFHEAFADIVALFQRFTMTEVLEAQIGGTRGNLEGESMLGSLAVQFGLATGARGALRSAIGTMKNGVWTRLQPDPTAYDKESEPHALGSILVAAIFDAFLAIYKTRTDDLLRIYTGGTGVLPAGAIHPDLVKRLAREASKAARHVLWICIRALDYVPPVDITFGEFLRAIITGDTDLVADDPLDYRVAFVESFRQRGIYPRDLQTLSIESLVWQGLDVSPRQLNILNSILAKLKSFANQSLYRDREQLFKLTLRTRDELAKSLQSIFQREPALAEAIGLDPQVTVKAPGQAAGGGNAKPPIDFEVSSLKRRELVGPDGQKLPQVVVTLTQSIPMQVSGSAAPMPFRGGCTLIVDLKSSQIRYAIFKRVNSASRQAQTGQNLAAAINQQGMDAYLAPVNNPFALLHRITSGQSS
jgi:hypothetical protein